MNTIEELRALPKIVANLEQKKCEIQGQIQEYYKHFEGIIKEVFIHINQWGSRSSIGSLEISDGFVKFIVYPYDDYDGEGYTFPIDTFLSAETLKNYIEEENKRIEEENKKIEKLKKEQNEKERYECDRRIYERLKKQFEGT